MAIVENTGKGFIGTDTGKGAVGANTGNGFVGTNTGKGILEQGNTDNVYMHPPYAVVVEPVNVGGNKTPSGASYTATKNLFDKAVSSVTNQSLVDSVTAAVMKNTPRIRVNPDGTGLILSGSKDVLDSDMGNELQKYLDETFKYADLKSANVSSVIDQLNKDVSDQIEERVVTQLLGANYDDYKDYRITMQQFQGTNPLSSTAAVPGYTKDGKKIKTTGNDKKTLSDWLKYYQDNYSATERAELYNSSREAIASGNKDFALWTPYLVMSGGNMNDLSANPVYGFGTWDKLVAGAKAVLNEGSARLLEGINQTAFDIGSTIANTQGFIRSDNLKTRAKRVLKTGSDITSKDIPWISEKAYNEKIDSIKDKSVRALGKADKNFLAAALGDFSNSEIDEAVRNSTTVEDVLKYASYKKYIDSRDNLSTVEKYEEERQKIKDKAAQGREWLQRDVDAGAIYAPTLTTAGSFAGTIMRYWAEAQLLKYATGGLVAPAEISDGIASKILSMLPEGSGALKALQTPVGSFLLEVAAEVPEDLIQTVIDDVMTGRADDIPLLMPSGDLGKDMSKLGESFAQNLAFRLAFTPIKAGANSIKQWRAAKKAAKAAGIDNVISDEYFIRNNTLKEAADAGRIIDLTKNSATIRNPDGSEQVLDNVAMLHFGTDAELRDRYPAVAEMLRKKGLLSDVIDTGDLATKIEMTKKSIVGKDFDGELKITDLTDADDLPRRYPDYDTWSYARKQWVDEKIDLGDERPRSQIEAEFEKKNPAPSKPSDGDTGATEPVTIYRTDLDTDLAGRNLKGDTDDLTVFSADVPRVFKGTKLVSMDVSPNKILTSDMAEKIFFEASDIAERGGDILDNYAATHNVDVDTVIAASVGDPYALARISGKPVIEGGDLVNGLNNGQYGYYVGVDSDFDKGISSTGYASVNGADTAAERSAIELANKAQDAVDTRPYDRSISEIVADKYKQGVAEVNEIPSSSSYKWDSPDVTKRYTSEEELFADRPVGKNMTETRQWMKNAEAFYMNRYLEQTMPEFTKAYPTVDEQQQFVRNMDYLFDLQKKQGETLESAIGKTYENEGIIYTVSQEDVDFYNNNIEPMMTGLREAGAAGVGVEPSTVPGYLPHSDYDPTILTAEDSMQQGVLWREYKGASTTDDDGNFSTGWLNPDLTARYKTFVDNMLWDSLGDQVIIAKYMEEFNADGLDVAANTVEKMVGGRRRLAHLVSESDSVKAVMKNLLGDGELPSEAQFEKAAKDLGSTDIVHDLYNPIYGEAKGLYQVKGSTNVKLMSKSDWMRSLATGDGTLYDNGGAMIVNGAADARYLAKRIVDAIDNGEKLDVHQMFVEYLTQNQRRTAKGASYIADKWMDKIAQRANNGGISQRAMTAELSNLIYGEGANRLFRFIGRMDTSQLTSANKQALDSLLFRHSALSKVKNTSGISAKLNNAANKLIAARMKSLFWFNYKNAVLQASECIRLFTEFKFDDALTTINRLASDKEFRDLVDWWVDTLVPERFIKSDSEAATGAMKIIADNSSVKNGELTVKKMSDGDIKSLGEKFDKFASSPVELGEAMKNRVLIAGILQEADSRGLSGNELYAYVNQRFERIGLAANEMGRLNASDNPLFRIGANLKTFQIRQFRMFINNIHDMNGTGEAVTYIIKNLGWKAGLALVLGKLGYDTAATLGLDPFDLMDDDYTGVDEDNYTGLDYAMMSPAAKLFLSGGFTGYINDAYWAARKAYEDSATVTEQTEGRVNKDFWPGMKIPGLTFDNVFDAFSGFIPGYTAGKRVYQMSDLMDSGWATSATGNKMYQAPTDPLDIAAGYVFGRSNTPNARAYYQTPDYLQGLLDNGPAGLAQQFGREFGGFRQFDPVDKQNYSDWFNGTAADEQQWNSGYYYFRDKINELQSEYQNSLSGYTTDKDKTQLDQSFNQKLADIEDQINRFTAAYEAKHPEGIDARKMRNLLTALNLYQPVITDTDEEREERELEAYNESLYRYSQAGLPAVTSYKRDEDTGIVEPVYSPQLRSALQGEFGLPEEAAAQIRKLYKDKWKDLGKQYRDKLFSTKGSKAKKAIQEEYIGIVRQDLDPIVQLYGNNIWSNDAVEDIIDDVFNSMVPKYGQSAKSYLKGIYKNYTGKLIYTEKGNETLSQINKLLDQGKTAQAKALARSLKQRVQENKTSLNREEMEKLQRILND